MTSFTWQDGERLIRFGRGALGDAPALLGEGFTLVTTERAAEAAGGVLAAAGRVLHVGPGRVDELAAGLLDDLEASPLLVALGGGRVVDVAKALAAARPPRQVAAIPTTLSAAEMTRGHRRAKGTPQDAPGVRPAIVLNHPALSASQPRRGGRAARAPPTCAPSASPRISSTRAPAPPRSARPSPGPRRRPKRPSCARSTLPRSSGSTTAAADRPDGRRARGLRLRRGAPRRPRRRDGRGAQRRRRPCGERRLRRRRGPRPRRRRVGLRGHRRRQPRGRPPGAGARDRGGRVAAAGGASVGTR